MITEFREAVRVMKPFSDYLEARGNTLIGYNAEEAIAAKIVLPEEIPGDTPAHLNTEKIKKAFDVVGDDASIEPANSGTAIRIYDDKTDITVRHRTVNTNFDYDFDEITNSSNFETTISCDYSTLVTAAKDAEKITGKACIEFNVEKEIVTVTTDAKSQTYSRDIELEKQTIPNETWMHADYLKKIKKIADGVDTVRTGEFMPFIIETEVEGCDTIILISPRQPEDL